jgi:hypothetical protein
LTNPEPVEPSTGKITSRNSRKESRPRLPENLPVVEEVIDPEPVKQGQSNLAQRFWFCQLQKLRFQFPYFPRG